MAMYGNNKNREKKKVDIELTSNMVDLLLKYVLSPNLLINLRALTNLNNLINRISFHDELRESRIKFELLKKILSLEVDKRLFDAAMLETEALSAFPEDSEFIMQVFDDIYSEEDKPLTEDDILYIGHYVEERLSYFYLYENKDILKQMIAELEEENPDIVKINNRFEKVITKLNKDLQNSKAANKDAATDFCIGGPVVNRNKNLESMVKYTIDSANKPSNHIVTGIKKFNELLNGGFENGRTYLIVAPPKSFKSGLLMNIGIWACRYNTFTPKDPEKVPCVLYVTMENTSKETIGRIMTHIDGRDVKDFNINEAVPMISQYVEGDRNVCFEIKYRKTKTISTADLDAMVDELSLEGKEVVLIIQDYTKRIRPESPQPDVRTELGEVVNDFCSLARDRDIPVISAAQINRMGITKIENAIKSKRGNLMNIVDKADIGESNLILENCDYAFCIIPETDPSNPNEKYLGFKLWVSRVAEPTTKFFLQKFENGMKLEEDINEDYSKSVEQISSSDDFDPVPNMQNRNNIQNERVNQRMIAQQLRRGTVQPPVNGEINL